MVRAAFDDNDCPPALLGLAADVAKALGDI